MADPFVDTQFTSGTVISSNWLNGINDSVKDWVAYQPAADIYVSTYANLASVDTTKYTIASTKGYWAAGDGGNGVYEYSGGVWNLQPVNGFRFARQYGVKADGVSDDTVAWQAAIDATPKAGTLLGPAGVSLISDNLILQYPITIKGMGPGSVTSGISGGSSDAIYTGIKQTSNAKSIFKMKARQGNYAFGAYGILGINFQDIMLEGKAIADRSVSAVTTDTTVNGGDYHIRHIHFNNVAIRFFQKGVDFTGINYLNVFVQCQFYWCNYGFFSARGAASDNGGQTRFFGCTFDLNNYGASLMEDGTAGGFGFFGCSLSESKQGIRTKGFVCLTVEGCEFESLVDSGIGAGIYINVASVPADSQRFIVGNRFLTSDNDIWIDKTSTGSTDGNFSFPCLIDGNAMLSSSALKVTVPGGHLPMSGKNFVFGATNSGTNAGFIASSQISTNYAGLDQRKFLFRRRFTFTNAILSNGFIVIPQGAIVTKARVYFTANATGATGFSIGDLDNGTRYLSAQNAQTATLGQWYGWQDNPGPQVVVNTTGMTTLVTSFTAGAQNAAGVVEVEYYIP